jgi:hypothetical protein
MEGYKAAVGELTQSANSGQLICDMIDVHD